MLAKVMLASHRKNVPTLCGKCFKNKILCRALFARLPANFDSGADQTFVPGFCGTMVLIDYTRGILVLCLGGNYVNSLQSVSIGKQ